MLEAKAERRIRIAHSDKRKNSRAHGEREESLFFWLAPPSTVTTAGRPAPAFSAARRAASSRTARAVAPGRLVGVPSRDGGRAAGDPALSGLAEVSALPFRGIPAVETRSVDVLDIVF